VCAAHLAPCRLAMLGSSPSAGSAVEAEPLGVIAAGHPLSAQAGADVLRQGGNAVDAALAAMLTSFACEPLLTSLGAGGYMLVVESGHQPTLLDFFVEAPGRGADAGALAELVPVSVSFGDAIQVFNIGPASVGTYGMAAGVCEAATRFGRIPLAELVAPAAKLARDGVELNVAQAYVVEILAGIVTSTPECAALFAPGGKVVRAGDIVRQPELADALDRLGTEGPAPFYTGDIAAAIVECLEAGGGIVTAEDLAGYGVVAREPIRASYRGREVLTNPPPSAGGILIAHALMRLDSEPGPPELEHVVAAMAQTQAMRTPEFLEGLDDPEFVQRFLSGRSRLGSTTHVAVLDRDGWACSVTSSNGEGAGVIVPGTGIHLNNMLGEQDLNPLGFHRHPPGRRMPSMMSPTALLRDGTPELVLGSAGSNRIRSAVLQTILRVIDDGLEAGEAVRAPRVHFEDGVVYAEPGVDTAALERAGRAIAHFRELNLFFGGVQAAARAELGRFSGGGDPRRGGAALVIDRSSRGERVGPG
jgi:gamma-glutamyltranspeptidase / glutathione hydrolase